MVCQVLQDVISSNKTVHTISEKDAGYVKLIAGNPDKEFDGVRFPIFFREVWDGRMTSITKWLVRSFWGV